MEEEPIKVIRETTRKKVLLNRRKFRIEEIDSRRSLKNLQINNSSDVAVIGRKLATNSGLTAWDIVLLQNALIDDPNNGEILMNTYGSLRGLMSLFVGDDVNKRIAAAGCFCNLALGSTKICTILSKITGVYIIASLRSMSIRFAESGAWTIGNIADSGLQACRVIVAQGAVTKLCDVMHQSSELESASLYALSQIAHQMKDELGTDHLWKIFEHLSRIDITPESSQLLFILSCHKDFIPIKLPLPYLNKIIRTFAANMEKHINICSNAADVKDSDMSCCSVIFLTRVLANFNNVKLYKKMLLYFVNHDLVDNLSRLLDGDRDNSVCWLLGNILNVCGDKAFSTTDWFKLKMHMLRRHQVSMRHYRDIAPYLVELPIP